MNVQTFSKRWTDVMKPVWPLFIYLCSRTFFAHSSNSQVRWPPSKERFQYSVKALHWYLLTNQFNCPHTVTWQSHCAHDSNNQVNGRTLMMQSHSTGRYSRCNPHPI